MYSYKITGLRSGSDVRWEERAGLVNSSKDNTITCGLILSTEQKKNRLIRHKELFLYYKETFKHTLKD